MNSRSPHDDPLPSLATAINELIVSEIFSSCVDIHVRLAHDDSRFDEHRNE